ncbi:Decaprenyl diphosphate synthase-like protein [Spinellus fusiger]|nr:Decaprenyl diphosphate synthase-like protein [Spinellus fusiger]
MTTLAHNTMPKNTTKKPTPRDGVFITTDLNKLSEQINKKKNHERNFIKRVFDGLCYLLLSLIHCTYMAYVSLLAAATQIRNAITCLRVDQLNSVMHLIEKDKSQLTKIPHHFTITVSNEMAQERTQNDWNTIIDDICLVSCWAWEFGIKELSVYDSTGKLKSMAMEINKQQSTTLHNWIQQSTSSSKKSEKSSLQLSILSNDDGKPKMVQAVQAIARHSIANGIDASEINVEMVNRFIHDNSNSDPDLMLVYDGLPHNYVSFEGYSPWHLRLTEIKNAYACRRLNYPLFSDSLYRYSCVKQRFGR